MKFIVPIPSSSSSKTYEVEINPERFPLDDYSVRCPCTGWILKARKGERGCRHTDQVMRFHNRTRAYFFSSEPYEWLEHFFPGLSDRYEVIIKE